MKRPQIHSYASDVVDGRRCWYYVCTYRPWGLPVRHTPEHMERAAHIYYDNHAAYWLRWETAYNG